MSDDDEIYLNRLNCITSPYVMISYGIFLSPLTHTLTLSLALELTLTLLLSLSHSPLPFTFLFLSLPLLSSAYLIRLQSSVTKKGGLIDLLSMPSLAATRAVEVEVKKENNSDKMQALGVLKAVGK